MTAIAAIQADDGTIWMGGDAAAVGGLSVESRADPKVFINGSFLIGYTSSFRMGQILQYAFSPPVPGVGQTPMEFLVASFVPAVRRAFEEQGFKDGDRDDHGGVFLVGYGGELFVIERDYQVGRSTEPFLAVGSGADLALGSLHTSHQIISASTPENRIQKALAAAHAFNAGVREPFTVLSLPPSSVGG